MPKGKLSNALAKINSTAQKEWKKQWTAASNEKY